MNIERLHTLIDRYESQYSTINNTEHNEIFKWSAVQNFREVWFSEAAKEMTFSQLFALAAKKSSVLINNSIISPVTGVVKMAEARPEAVEHLFRNVLFAEYTTLDELQDHMDAFLEQMEAIRQELFPRFYRYKQDRHAASCYLAFLHPETHYIYRYNEAEEFAKYIEFGKDLGAGEEFCLGHYYEMADRVVEALQTHTELLERYESLLNSDPQFYCDKSLHLMAFDLMYCCRCYNLFYGMPQVSKKERIRAYELQKQKEKEAQDRQDKMAALQQQIHEIDVQKQAYEEISLLNVEVMQSKYGKGTVISQKNDQILVRFKHGEVGYIINKKYPLRPRFEDDDRIVDAYTAFALLQEKRAKLVQELESIN